MGFDIPTDTDYRQRINLSKKAWAVMQEDKSFFGVAGNATFINKIIANFHDSAKASCENYLHNMKKEVSDRFAAFHLPAPTTDEIIQIYMQEERELLKKETEEQTKNKFHSDIYRLNKDNVEYLRSNECTENQFYHFYDDADNKVEYLGLYLKCLIEEYASLPYIQREKIYFKEEYETISFAIEAHQLIKAYLANGKPIYIYPYKLIEDPLSTRYYLACYTKKERTASDKKPASLRITRLKNIKALSTNGKLTEAEKQELEKKLTVRSVQFLVDHDAEIRVYLTDKGIRKYHQQIHLRPENDSIYPDGHTYVFHCTYTQIEYYFWPFGKDAQILYPPELRNKFKNMYADAYAAYDEIPSMDQNNCS